MLCVLSASLVPQSTRSRQGEERNPEVELEVSLVVATNPFSQSLLVIFFCLYIRVWDTHDLYEALECAAFIITAMIILKDEKIASETLTWSCLSGQK